MPKYSAFTPFGMLAYSSKPSHAQAIYEALKDNFGDNYNEDFNGVQQGRLYAAAMVLASSQYQLDRAGNNRSGKKATELLGKLEHDFQVVPAPSSTLVQRRRVLSAREKVTRGARRDAVVAALAALLGEGFISYEVTDVVDCVSSPSPAGSIGIFPPRGTPKKTFRLNTPVVTLGVAATVNCTTIPGSQPPIAGEAYCVDPDTRSPSIENITLLGVTAAATPGSHVLTAVFNKPHEAGAIATRPHPVLISNKRYARIVVTVAASKDPEKRRLINEQMQRMARGVSQWAIVHDQGTFLLNDAARSILPSTLLG